MKSTTTVEISEKELKQAISEYLQKRNQHVNSDSIKLELRNGTQPVNATFARVEVQWSNPQASAHWR